MTERLYPEEYERRRITDTSAQEEYLDSQLAEERKLREYLYGAEPEPSPEEPEPVVQYVPVGEVQPANSIPWGLIGVISIVGLLALGIIAVVAIKK